MNKIDELIQQYCPDGVEYVKLGNVAEVGTGSSNGNEAEDEGVYPFFVRSQSIKRKNDYEYDEEAIIIPGEGGIGDIFHYIKGKYALHQRVYRIHFVVQSVNVKFAYHYMRSTFKQFIMMKAVSATVVSIRKPMIEGFEIPLPPLPVQEAIVNILDRFAEYAAELQAELQARQQQYNYYRDTLLSNFTPDPKVKEYTLGELGTFTRGNGLQKKDFTETGVGCIHYGQIYTRFGAFTDKTLTYVDEALASRLLKVEKGNLVIACTSENVEDICKCVAWLGEDDICTGGHACVYKHKQNPKYIAYFFQTEYFFKQKVKYTYGTKVKDIKPDSLAKIKIPLPSLEEQEKIVSILDNLYNLINDLSQGLPAEIEARQQQYEYYRDQLLTFKRM